MSDQRVQQTQARLDDEARAEIRVDARIYEVKALLDTRSFEELSLRAETEFTDWYADRYEDGGYDWVDNCHVTSSWYCNNVEVDTEAVATAFVEWIGD